jgi:predicted regulator of Ras-like GTPase activity (Roadblock/LC7/MglB family)
LLYFIVWFTLFSQESIQTSFSLAFQTLFLRWGTGLLFGILTWILSGINLKQGLQFGLYQYLPAVLIQVICAPLIIKSVTADKRRPRRSATGSRLVGAEDFGLAHRHAQTEDSTGWDEILAYVKDYSGVEVCLLVDEEGMIVAQKGDPRIETEALAPLAGLLEESCLKVLNRISEKKLEKLETFTPHLRFSLHRVLDYWLVVISDRHTDDLLNIRIQRAVEQLTKKISEKYPPEVYRQREEEHVRNS